MNFKWFQNKLTFVIIPEANGSVVRLKLARGVVWSVAASVMITVGAAAFLYLQHAHTAASTFLKTSELSGRTAKLEQALTSKNRRIEELQNDIYMLSKQAAEVHSQVAQMKKLEEDLQKLAPVSAEKNAESGGLPAGEAATAGTEAASAALGMGGPAVPVTHEEIRRLAMATGVAYMALQNEMNKLETSLSDSRQQLQEKQERLRRTPTLWPTDSRIVTSNYGYRQDPFTKKLSFHRGVDIAGKLDDPVYAAGGGVVHEVGYDKLHGHNVIVEHTSGLLTWYMHLNRATVRKGDLVDKGDPIGKLGTTGRSTGPHLHYEVLLGGKSTDPSGYLPMERTKEEKTKS
ncbi:M23 family metallopeptidase [Paenibacillus validus]|uniref:Peptidoglycan DD-metalloendopeptidase family protein n=2 Tax=Paenibacillus validus TaxID=44253 RepID=A0A7X2ZBV9_9BACL|nr:M23 family metallopeptidase [Paenibacillus validus]MUG72089.1 peptidoglycan DD-metalloendopeptidase family protein [Paenibacillus validus]